MCKQTLLSEEVAAEQRQDDDDEQQGCQSHDNKEPPGVVVRFEKLRLPSFSQAQLVKQTHIILGVRGRAREGSGRQLLLIRVGIRLSSYELPACQIQ